MQVEAADSGRAPISNYIARNCDVFGHVNHSNPICLTFFASLTLVLAAIFLVSLERAIMCGIAGILFKNGVRPKFAMTTGEALIEMLIGLEHRGPDSAGYAIYQEALDKAFRLRFLVRQGTAQAEDVGKIRDTLSAEGAAIIAEETVGCTFGTVVSFEGSIAKLSFAIEHAARVISFGRSLDIVKDVGSPRDLADRYQIAQFNGSHAIGHTRLATESGVHPETSHPFWATGFADVAVVHNGQLTNYWLMRRRLEQDGMEFHTENDTELIAVYLAHQMSRGHSLDEALHTALSDLDGTFSCLVATRDSIGYAKDKLAAKPMVKYEDDVLVAIASEEAALNRLFPGQTLKTMEPPPMTCGFWSRRQ